jgi:glutamate dehydrogenase
MSAARSDRPESFYRKLQKQVTDRCAAVPQNLTWLERHMPAYFTITMGPETEALARLALHLPTVKDQNSLVLLDRAGKLILARCDRAGSLYETLQALGEREVAYAEIIHSNAPLPGTDTPLEIQRFDFQSTDEAAASAQTLSAPAPSAPIHHAVAEALARDYPDFPVSELDASLTYLWRQNPDYVEISPPERIARILWVLRQTSRRSGFFFDVQPVPAASEDGEWRVVFGVAQPPRRQFLLQILEVFRRLDLGVRRSYSLTLTQADGPCFIGNFYIRAHDRSPIDASSDIYRQLKTELYNTQILAIESFAYRNFVAAGTMTGPDASLAEAMVAFCHTNLSHGDPDRFDLDTVRGCFESHPDILAMLIALFRLRFDPDIPERQPRYQDALAAAETTVAAYNTGQRYLDEIRRVVFETALKMVRHCLKTNFFVPEKYALAFRLDPAYLGELAPELRRDLPQATPFRITFFFGRHGFGYHIGFSDIARGGWRTVLCRSGDECISAGNTLFREVFVLAHTQHLKNKDIYEGGSKMTAICDVRDCTTTEDVTRRLHKFQYGLINAFLDIFVTDGGTARHPAVVDYHGEEEPIELGPDENMHDETIETIARLAVERGYVLGAGIISSKQVGINHKAYGVTSRGVIQTAEIALRQVGIEMSKDVFAVKMTGGPFGDVAGNSLRLLLDRCPKVRIVAMVDASGGFFDPQGADPRALDDIVLKADLDHFDPQRLHPGGFIVFRTQQRREAMRQLHRKLLRTEAGIEEQWITADAFFNETNRLIFETAADLFLPCGGRPETIDATNWACYFSADGAPSARVIVEGANSFISPEARNALQDRGVILVRDASANKCGVICSSYEIIANLLLSDEEFLADKEIYVSDVLEILARRARDEAELIFSRHRQAEGRRRYTEISVEISQEINQWYARLFAFFQAHPALVEEPDFRRVLLAHLPVFIQHHEVYRNRPDRLPQKIKWAILAVEIATRIVYRGGWEQDFENRLRSYVKAGADQAGGA